RHQFQPVGMLERQNRTPAQLVIGDDGASAIEGWRSSKAGGTSRARTWIDTERQAAAIAQGPVQKSDLAPACGAETMAFAQRLAASDAKRRKHQIRQRMQKPAFPIQRHFSNLATMNQERPLLFDFRAVEKARARARRIGGDRFLDAA